jgi:Ca2+-binding RTX toxin-like protein
MRGRALPLLATAVSLTALAVVALFVVAPSAGAAATCAYDDPTGVVTVAMGANESAIVSRDADGAILLDGTPCDVATVTNTDTIVATGPGPGNQLTIDFIGGPFLPGRTAEADGADSEIEFQVDIGPGGSGGIVRVDGGDAANEFVLGAGGLNLNASEAVGDPDVTVANPVAWDLRGLGGDDTLSVAGGAGTGAPPDGGASLAGGDGADTFLGALGGSTIDGGAGDDAAGYIAAERIDADLGAGVVQIDGQAEDSIVEVENLTGTLGNDRIVGNGVDNTLRGLDGDDVLDGAGGDDQLVGGLGDDTADFGNSNKGVDVDLTAGTATGPGADTLSEIENVNGTGFVDVIEGTEGRNSLRGRSGSDIIRGLAGPDTIIGAKGNDVLFGGNGRDTLKGGVGKDQLDGGQDKDVCIPGPDPDSWTACES